MRARQEGKLGVSWDLLAELLGILWGASVVPPRWLDELELGT